MFPLSRHIQRLCPIRKIANRAFRIKEEKRVRVMHFLALMISAIQIGDTYINPHQLTKNNHNYITSLFAFLNKPGDRLKTADDLITLHRGDTTVPDPLNEGLYDIRDDYYLVIYNVTMETAGRYFCRVSDFRGYIIRSHTDVIVKGNLIIVMCHTCIQSQPSIEPSSHRLI